MSANEAKQAEAADVQPKLPKGRGGKRPGTGRKPNYLKRLGMEPMTAAKILAHFNELDV